MVLSTIRMVLPIDRQDEVVRILKSNIMQSRDGSDCLRYRIYRDIEDENILMLQADWKNEESLNVHIRSKEYRNLLLALEMSLKKPEVRFDIISSSAGLEFIEEIRNSM